MKIYTCESCDFTFRYPIHPTTCPDCGQKLIRPANAYEIERYHLEQRILAEEIKMGLYPVAAL